MEHNDKDKSEAKKEQSEEAPQQTTTSEEPPNASENNSEEIEDISQNDAEKNKVENPKEEEEDEEADLNQDVLRSAVEYQMDENNRPVCRYNTVCYRKIKRGNTKQRIDEFESILNV